MSAKKLGRYEILGELGKGAMGLVYLAKDPLIGRKLALKTFRLGYSAADQDLEQFRVRFLREAQSAGILNHPNIVTIHDVVVEDGGDFFIAMEYVEGTDLKLMLQKDRRFDLEFAVETVAQIADGLGYAHSNRVIHRDIKPANVIMTPDHQAKITDFGIARVDTSNLTTEGQLLGTPNYMPPEAIMGREVDHRADLFSLGVMFYEMLTGKKPFQADNLTAVSHRIVYDDPQPVDELIDDVPKSILEILEKSLKKKPEERYQSGIEMAKDLRASLVSSAEDQEPRRSSGSFLAVPSAMNAAGVNELSSRATTTPGVQESAPNLTQDHGSGGTIVAPIAPPAEPPPDPVEATPRFPRFLWAGVAAVVLIAIVGLLLTRVGESPSSEGLSEVAEVSQAESHESSELDEGLRMIEQGDFRAALDFFDRIVAREPANREARRYRDQARTQLDLETGDDPRLREGRAALEARDYSEAMRIAEAILADDKENQKATELAAQASAGLERRDQVRNRLRGSSSGAPADTSEQAANPPPVAVEQKGTIEVDFFTETSAGQLTIYSGQQKLYQESFEFLEAASGVLRRRAPTSGRLTTELTLDAGDISLFVYVKPRGSDLRSKKIDAQLASNAKRTLQIRISRDGRMSAELLP